MSLYNKIVDLENRLEIAESAILGGASVDSLNATTITSTEATITTLKTDTIKSSAGTTAVSISSANVVIAGDLTVTGNDIKASDGTTSITLAGSDVAIAGDLTVNGSDIKSSAGTVFTLSGDAVTNVIKANAGVKIGSSGDTINYFETGSWAPGLGAGWSTTGLTSSSGYYLRLNDLCFITGYIAAAGTITVTAGGNAYIDNLPFTPTDDRFPATFSRENPLELTSSIGAGLFVETSRLYAPTISESPASSTKITFSGFFIT